MKNTNKKRKAIALLSGGLDSRLAVKLILDQGIAVEALNFSTVFCTCTSKGACKSEARAAAEAFGIPVKVLNATRDLMDAVRSPKYGYGRGLNPCLDCRINMFKRARAYMQETGADFVFTGEVWGERPMSQRPDAMRIIEQESGLSGYLVRPLSAQLFEPTIPEQEGWLDRSQLLALEGRSRKPQMQLARELGVNDYPCPAGGCLLTEKQFAIRLRALLDENDDPRVAEIQALKLGRIFFSSEGARVIIPRNEDEDGRLEALAQPGDLLLQAADCLGPTAVAKARESSGRLLAEAGALAARYGQGRDRDSVVMEWWAVPDTTATGGLGCSRPERHTIEVSPAEGFRLSENLKRI
jgi:tRNA U34 2-thiouridine synthase MnmA/TrmU